MKFISLISQLKESYHDDIQYTDNQVCLLGPNSSETPIAVHFLYAPMSETLMQYLVQSYKRTIPTDLLAIYSYANGMELFRTMRQLSNGLRIPASQISIYGIPLLSDRKRLEPFNISIEDLSRPLGTPKTWLKFGCSREICQEAMVSESELYVDTDVGTVYQSICSQNSLQVNEQWPSIDDCLCELFEKLL